MADEEFMHGDLLATVRVQDLPASREVVAVERQESGAWRVCGSATANADGIADLSISGSKTSRVYAFAIDHWGEPFTPNKTVGHGDIIRPSAFLGWLYRVTTPGTLPSEEPVWWNSTPGMPRPVGSAMAQAEMYFQPIAHGPVDIEWEDKGLGDPHWDNVVSLMNFNGDVFVDKADGTEWKSVGGKVEPNGRHGNALRLIGGDSSRVTRENSPKIRLSADDFTIEMWVMRDDINVIETSLFGLYGYTANRRSYNLVLRDSTAHAGLSFRVAEHEGGNVTPIFQSSYKEAISLLPANKWIHIAVSRVGNIFKLFIDGALIKEEVHGISIYNNTVDPLVIGSTGPAYTGPWTGLIDEFRFTKGVARYTENFTPPTGPFPNFKLATG